jgi:shikimate dehydrogenase
MALLQAGCPTLTVTNRTHERSERLVSALQERFPQAQLSAVPFARAAQVAQQSALIVNATSVGLHHTTDALLPETCFRARQVVYDIVYRPLYTPLLCAAQRHGATVIPGLDMLIGQGAAAFRLWTGLSFPVPMVQRELYTLLQTVD